MDKQELPLVSIIIPAYNVEAYVKRIYDNIIEQGYPNWELIFVDDKSSDGTKEQIEFIADADERVKLYCLDKNSGTPLKPRLKGVEMAKGYYVCLIDADDSVSKNYIRNLVDRAIDTGADVTLPFMYNCRQEEKVRIFDDSILDKDRVYLGRDLVYHTLYTWDFGMNGGLYVSDFYYKSLVKLLNIKLDAKYDITSATESIPFIDEVGSRILLMEADKVAFAPNAEYLYLYNPDSVVELKSSRYFELLDSNMFIRQMLLDYDSGYGAVWDRLHLHMFVSLSNMMTKYINCRKSLPNEERVKSLRIIRRAYRNYNLKDASQALSKFYYFIFSSGFYGSMLIFSLLQLMKRAINMFRK